jgi:hypothetical protein
MTCEPPARTFIPAKKALPSLDISQLARDTAQKHGFHRPAVIHAVDYTRKLSTKSFVRWREIDHDIGLSFLHRGVL